VYWRVSVPPAITPFAPVGSQLVPGLLNIINKRSLNQNRPLMSLFPRDKPPSNRKRKQRSVSGLILGVALEELIDHVDDRRSSARQYALPRAPGVDVLDQPGLDPDVDIRCFSFHIG
jgi:hypothetical protein